MIAKKLNQTKRMMKSMSMSMFSTLPLSHKRTLKRRLLNRKSLAQFKHQVLLSRTRAELLERKKMTTMKKKFRERTILCSMQICQCLQK